MNGELFCSLRDDGAPSYQDTCSFTCNTGYELIGSATRTCQSDGSWSGSDVVCSNSTGIIIGAVLGSLFLLILIILICGIMLIKNRRKHQSHNISIYGKGSYIIM